MKFQSFKKTWMVRTYTLIAIGFFCYASLGHAHTAGATLDQSSTIRSFTGMAFVTCFDDGNGPADNMIVRIKDKSPPVPGLLVNVMIVKGNKSNGISDIVSGDVGDVGDVGDDGNGGSQGFSPFITLQNGPGTYWLIVNKTNVGARSFEVEYHCNTKTGVHTGTDIGVSQFGEPVFNP